MQVKIDASRPGQERPVGPLQRLKEIALRTLGLDTGEGVRLGPPFNEIRDPDNALWFRQVYHALKDKGVTNAAELAVIARKFDYIMNEVSDREHKEECAVELLPEMVKEGVLDTRRKWDQLFEAVSRIVRGDELSYLFIKHIIPALTEKDMLGDLHTHGGNFNTAVGAGVKEGQEEFITQELPQKIRAGEIKTTDDWYKAGETQRKREGKPLPPEPKVE